VTVLADAVRRLRDAGVPTAEHDARALLRHVTGTDVEPVDEEQLARFRAVLDRRAARVPLQHLTGRAPFRHLDLHVGPGVFIPRPETELLVDAVLAAAAADAEPIIVDLCAGTGAVALSVAHELARGRVYAVESEPAAFQWLQRNAVERAAAGDLPVVAVLADAGRGLGTLSGRADVLAANPPYLSEADRDLVEPEVRDHDPSTALWAADGGMSLVRVVVAAAERLLRPGGCLVVEHADGQGVRVTDLLAERGWVEILDHPDLAGRDRFTTARRR
jgi:release factor glutamine methyltransferase